ncbi:MAG: cupin domain-containing protein [Verrucomicrobiales bacterium]|nr:cupin domain-containing protein [Verrucomicrobiales bacterium]
MNCDELQQMTALHALGALDGLDVERLRHRLSEDPSAAEELTRFLDVAGVLTGLVKPVQPSASVRAKVMDRIRKTPQVRDSAAAAVDVKAGEPPVPEGLHFLRADQPWLPAPLPGSRFKLISSGEHQSYIMLMIELAPGAGYPEHDHFGVEDMYILTGDLLSEGRLLGPGDSLHAEPGSHHHELRSINGCTALMVLPREALAMLVPG